MKNLDLENEKISKLLISFSIPCIISMLINSVYDVADHIEQEVGTLGNALLMLYSHLLLYVIP